MNKIGRPKLEVCQLVTEREPVTERSRSGALGKLRIKS